MQCRGSIVQESKSERIRCAYRLLSGEALVGLVLVGGPTAIRGAGNGFQ